MAFAEQTDLPVFQIDIIQIHANQFCKAHPAVQKQHDHAVVPLRKVALGLRAFQQIHGLFRRQILWKNLVLFWRVDRRCRVALELVDLIDKVIIEAVQAGQPTGGR